MKKFYLIPLLAFFSTNAFAQAKLTTKNNVRIWEHHSSAINGGQPFGTMANGKMSGYDFMRNIHFSSIDSASSRKWSGTEYMNIDLVEHNGPFGTGTSFGFTSGVSTIWNGDIKGNGKTMFMEAPAGFNYDTITNVATIRAAFDSTKATASIAAATAGKVYLARVRKGTRYIAMKITNVKNAPGSFSQTDTLSVYFDFNYKYGDFFPTSVEQVKGVRADMAVYPNPGKGRFTINLNTSEATTATVSIYNQMGQTVKTLSSIELAEGANSIPFTIADIPSGMYYIAVKGDGINVARSIVKE